ncbi:MAG: hypothetical protein V5A88_03505 [Candidatus Thermoplasmatota archaeon]
MTPSEGEVTTERLDLKPEWVQEIGPRREDIQGPYLLFLIVAAIIFTLLLFSGGTQLQLLTTFLIIWVGLTFIFAVSQKTKSISNWTRSGRNDQMENIPLKRRSKLVERALSGLKLSQTLLERRLRREIIERLKDEEDLSEGEMKKLLKDPMQLKEVLNDDVLTDFLLDSRRLKDIIRENEDSSKFSKIRSFFRRSEDEKEERRRAYQRKIRKVMKRISDWREE